MAWRWGGGCRWTGRGGGGGGVRGEKGVAVCALQIAIPFQTASTYCK